MKNPSDDIKKKAERTERLFRENLNYYMDAKGRSQADLAKALGVSTSTASCWLKGQRVPPPSKACWAGISGYSPIRAYRINTLIRAKTVQRCRVLFFWCYNKGELKTQVLRAVHLCVARFLSNKKSPPT